jgi:hypothetical protein
MRRRGFWGCFIFVAFSVFFFLFVELRALVALWLEGNVLFFCNSNYPFPVFLKCDTGDDLNF